MFWIVYIYLFIFVLDLKSFSDIFMIFFFLSCVYFNNFFMFILLLVVGFFIFFLLDDILLKEIDLLKCFKEKRKCFRLEFIDFFLERN